MVKKLKKKVKSFVHSTGMNRAIRIIKVTGRRGVIFDCKDAA